MSEPMSKQLLVDLREQCQLLIEDVGDISRRDFSLENVH